MSANTPLSYADRKFLLEGQPIRLFSAAIHYFRVVPDYWNDRLLKAKACGLNTIETYVSWNLHEPKPGHFVNTGHLDIRKFIKMAADLDLYVILRPGPYICSEWDFGGLPAWLLADPDMKVRSNYKGYQESAIRYLKWLMSQVADLQKSKGGPIIAVQVENEFGSFSHEPEHLEFLRHILLDCGVTELLVTSDNESASRTAPILKDVLPTANGQTIEEIRAGFEMIRKTSDQYPLMVMEFWSGWFDHWGQKHETRDVDTLVKALEFILQQEGSVNFYMFHGGTNFGFMAGALNLSRFKADVTSYDYDAPVSEDGELTDKFWAFRQIIARELAKMGVKSAIPAVPANSNKRAPKAVTVKIEEMLCWKDVVKAVEKTTTSLEPQCMESYRYADGEVQSHGYIVYRTNLGSTSAHKLSLNGHVRDMANILVNGQMKARADWEVENPVLDLAVQGVGDTDCDQVLDIVVENLGRVNYTTVDRQQVLNEQRKGLSGPVSIDGRHIQNWQIFALDFCSTYIQHVEESEEWKAVESAKQDGPAVYRASFQVEDGPYDFFVLLDGWYKGILIINGFNLGRYWQTGPQRTLYLPGPLLRKGTNQILIFEEQKAASQIILDTKPQLA